MTILVIGYYGFGNAGDEAILASIAEQLRSAVPAVRIVVSSGDPAATAADHSVEAVASGDLDALERAVDRADLVVIGGGGLFHDYWGADPDTLLTGAHWGLAYYAGCALLAALAGKPLMLWAVGVGPLFSDHGVQLTKTICDLASSITVRDDESRKVLEGIGVPAERIEVTADPAVLYVPAVATSLTSLLDRGFVLQKPVLGVAARHWAMGVHPEFLQNELARALDGFLEETGGSVVLFPFQDAPGEHENDRAMAALILDRMRLRSRATIARAPMSPGRIFGAFAECDAILGMRLHALVFAASAGIPSVALSYDPKVASFEKSRAAEALDVKALDARVLVERLKAAVRVGRRSPGERDGPLAELRERALRTFPLALDLLKRGRMDIAAQIENAPPRPEWNPETLGFLRRSLRSHIRIGEESRAERENLSNRIAAFERENETLRATIQSLGVHIKALEVEGGNAKKQFGEIERFLTVFYRELDVYRTQRAWRAMLLIRKAYDLFFRRSKAAFARWAFGAATGNAGSLDEYEPRFPDIASYVSVRATAPVATTKPPSNPPQRNQLDVVILAIIDFDFRFQRPQQIAAELARRGHRVFWISPSRFLAPTSTPLYEISSIRDNIHEVHLRSPIPDIYMGELRPDQLAAMIESLGALYNDWNIGENIAFLQLPFWRQLGLRLKEQHDARLVYDCMDDWDTFQNMGAFNVSEEKLLVEECDLLVVTGAELERKYGTQGLAPVLIRNGADFDFFAQARATDLLSTVPKPIVGYFGAIADWIDLDLIVEVARSRPAYSFVLIGQVFDRDMSALQSLPNVFLLGNKPYAEIPNYLYYFDACLIPFLLNPVTKATDPVKLYEYFSLGKPVIATDMAELAQCGELISIGRGVEDFAQKIDRALQEHDESLRERRIAFARNNTWGARVDLLQSEVQKLYPLVSILIVTFNSEPFVLPCLESIERNTAHPNYETIVVDNASSDGTARVVAQCAAGNSRVRLLRLEQNSGFAAGNNRAALEAKGEYLVFLNTDTMVTPGWLHGLLEHIRRDPRIGQVCPVTNFAGNEAKINVSYRNSAEMDEFAVEVRQKNRGKEIDVRVAPLFCSLVPRAVWTATGELDTSFGIGMFEDDDFSMRVRQAGFRVVAADDCFVHHFGQGSFSKIPTEAYQLLFESNRKRMEAKWRTGWEPHRTRPGVRPPFEEERFEPATFVVKT